MIRRLRRCFLIIGLLVVLCGSSLAQTDSSGQAPPSDPGIALARAARSFQARQYTRALSELDALVQAYPRYRPARLLRAMAHGQLALQQQETGDAAQARQSFQLMLENLESLMEQVTDADSIVRLLDAVVYLKLAGPPPASAPAGGDGADSKESVEMLRKAIASLELYLNPPSGLTAPSGMNRLRAELFLGIADYRLARFVQVADEARAGGAPRPASQEVRTLLEKGRKQFDGLSDETIRRLLGVDSVKHDTAQEWLSYTYYYLAQVEVELANTATSQPRAYREYLTSAAEHYRLARECDTAPQGGSRSGVVAGAADLMIGTAPGEVSGKIGEALTQLDEQAGIPFQQDFRIDWRTGFVYDTNVPLLGGNVPPPRSIGRKDNFRFSNGVILSYSGTLAALAGIEDPELDKWELGLAGRVINGWNASIHEYNEQDYGASVALQYRLMDQSTSGHKHGPLYAGIQYDYDYFLLGNNGFLRLNRVTPRLTLYTFNRHAVTTLGFSYEDRNYLERLYNEQFDRDGNYYSLDFTQSVELVDMTQLYSDIGLSPWGLASDPNEDDPFEYRRYLKPYAGFQIGWDETKGAEYRANRYMAVGGINVPLPWGLLFDFRGQWEWQCYDGFNGGDLVDYRRRQREDFIQRYGVGLERSFVLVPGKLENRGTLKIDRVVLTIRGDMYFIDDDSNVEDRLGQAVYSYDRALYGLSFTLSFN